MLTERLVNPILLSSVFRKRIRLLDEKEKRYSKAVESKYIVQHQLRLFNKVWEGAHQSIPFYAEWRAKHNLPKRISSIKELENFPALTKTVINSNRELVFKNASVDSAVSTGGTTGEPTLFPSAKSDFDTIYADAYLGRGWWGLKPLDRIISLWGHSHLFGSGWRGQLKEFSRKLKDSLIRTRRLNAYDMTPQTIEKYYGLIKTSNPKALIGYTSCLFKLARFMVDQKLDGSLSKHLKVVIPTAETVSQSDVSIMEKAFKVPIVIEYGMAETGAIAYSDRKTDNIRVFWDSFFCRCDENKTLHVSTLYNKKFPLINYCTEDLVTPLNSVQGSILTMNSIDGRSQEAFDLNCEITGSVTLSGILFVHILKSLPGIYSVQCEKLPEKKVKVHLTADSPLNLESVREYLLDELRKKYPEIDAESVILIQARNSKLSLAGKEQIFLRE